MLTDSSIERILTAIPRLAIAVVGDLFLDRYLDIDPKLTEPSIETGLDAYQVVRVRSNPGAAGTVMNNLIALGVKAKNVCLIAVTGDDGEGHELRTALWNLGVHVAAISWSGSLRTPTYTKPMLEGRELNRLDIKNRSPLRGDLESQVLDAIVRTVREVDAMVVVDQVSEVDCGVVTSKVRERLGELGEKHPDKIILVDSRERIGLFRNVWLKPNQTECARALGSSRAAASIKEVRRLAARCGRPVFCTRGERGILAVDPRNGTQSWEVPAFPVRGPIDAVGAGDSTSAGIACALAAGTSIPEAAAFGNLVASITIQQLGTTGTANPEQIRRRWEDVKTK